MNDPTSWLTGPAHQPANDTPPAPGYPDLGERVGDASRRLSRLGRRRTAGAVLAATVALGAVGVTAVRMTSGDDDHARSGMSLVEASGTAVPGAGAVAGGSPSGAAATTDTAAVPGTLIYLSATQGSAITVTTLRGTQTGSSTFGTARNGDQAVVVSPDLTKLVLVNTPNYEELAPGALILVDRQGNRRTVASDVSWDGGHWPVWAPDSSAVFAYTVDGWVRVDLSSGKSTAVGIEAGTYLTFSANGNYRGYTPGDDKVIVTRADGTVVHQASLSNLPDCERMAGCPTSVQAVSDDGAFVSVGAVNTDPTNIESAYLVVDMRTGNSVRLPTLDKRIDEIFFRPNGDLVVRGVQASGYRLYLVSAAGTVISSLPQPAALRNARLVGYRP